LANINFTNNKSSVKFMIKHKIKKIP